MARVIRRPGDWIALKRKVSEYVSQYVSALLKYRTARADPYGDGLDETSKTPMINIPSGSREKTLPGKIPFDKVASDVLKVKLPSGLKAIRKNDLLLSFGCFQTFKNTQNYLPYLLPNEARAALPGFAPAHEEHPEFIQSTAETPLLFIWKALEPDVRN